MTPLRKAVNYTQALENFRKAKDKLVSMYGYENIFGSSYYPRETPRLGD